MSGHQLDLPSHLRPCVASIICHPTQPKVWWGRRTDMTDQWQCPQGGIDAGETPREAIIREVWEEVGLVKDNYHLIAEAENWVEYTIPKKYRKSYKSPKVTGQIQKWHLLQCKHPEQKFSYYQDVSAEFDRFEWVSYWYPLADIMDFKKQAYQQAFTQLWPTFRSLYSGMKGTHIPA